MKRFVCFLLAMILIMGMVPATAVTAFAASERTTSDKAIQILKGSATFYEKVGTAGKIGYSTDASYVPTNSSIPKDYKNDISKEDADTLLREFLKKVVDKEINQFAKDYNVDLTQQEHDALAVHMYRNGTGTNAIPFRIARVVKTIGTAADRSAMVNAFLKAYAIKASDDEILKAKLNVAFAEAAMYLYGDYGYNGNNRFAYAILDRNTFDKMDKVVIDSEDEVVAFVREDGYNLEMESDPKFAGWYRYDRSAKTTVGYALQKLTNEHDGKVILAKYYGVGNVDEYGNLYANYSFNTKVLSDLNLYNGIQKDKVDILKHGSEFKVTHEHMTSAGDKWILGEGTNTDDEPVVGWIKLGKLKDAEIDNIINKPIATATITAAVVKVYPGATSDGVGHVTTLAKDQVVNIYETKIEMTNHGNKVWGKITYRDGGKPYFGWINLVNATVNETKGESGAEEGQTGKIANSNWVNIRSTPGIASDNLIAGLEAGTKVTILEMSENREWAKIKWREPSYGYTQGWVYMHYVQLDSASQGSTAGGNAEVEEVLYTGIVTSNINLNVREYADVYARRVGSLPTGTKVNIYETTEYRNMEWGRIGEDEWVCLAYVNMTKVENKKPEAGKDNGITTLQGTVTTASVNVLKNYNSNAQVLGTLKKGDVVTILEKNTEITTTGSRIWGRIATEEVAGWINLAYVDLKTVTTVAPGNDSGTGSSSNSTNPTPAIISDCISVNVREEAGVYSRQLTKLNNGTAVTVYEQTTYAGAPWARIKWNNGLNEGWVCMYYVTLNAGTGSTNTDSNGILNGTSSNAISATGFVNNAYLNVRAGAGLGFAQVGTLNQGAKVTLFEQAVSDGLIWGRISYNNTPGWVCMSYITVENASSTGKGVMGTIARCFSKANVRSAPGTNNALVSTVNVGSRVEVFEVKTHGAQKWGRIPQGWICMEYVLLDSELPEGTILDATTAPTTEATTAPTVDETVNKVGEVAFKIEAGILDETDVYNNASTTSVRIGKINAGLGVDILALKNNGAELWGRVDQYGTAGWIRMHSTEKVTVAYAFDGYVNTENAPVYVEANTNSAVKGSLSANKKMTFTKVTTDGENVYGWVEEGIYGWLPMSKISSSPVELMTVLKSGDSVGSGRFNPVILHGTTFTDVSAYDVIGGSKVLFKMQSGVRVNVTHVRFENGKIWARVEQPKKPGAHPNWDYIVDDGEYSEYGEAWFDLSKVNYSMQADTEVNKINVRSSMDNSSTTNKVGQVSGTINICQLAFDSYGNLWARITGNSDAQLNGMFVMVRTAAQGVDGYEVKNYGKIFIGNHDVVIESPSPVIPDETLEGEVLPEGDIDSAETPDMT